MALSNAIVRAVVGKLYGAESRNVLEMAEELIADMFAELEGQRADTAAAERAYDEARDRISVLERRLAVAEGLIDESRPVVAWASKAQAMLVECGKWFADDHFCADYPLRHAIEALLAEVEPAPAKTPFEYPTLREVSRGEAARIAPGLVAAIEGRL